MDKTDNQKRKIDDTSASDRRAKKVQEEKQSSDAVSNDGATPSSAGLSGEAIPAPVWGRVMEYLPYTDVLTCLLVSSMLSFEAPKYVGLLTIMKSCELDPLLLVRKRRRFENVKSLDIFCLVVDDEADEDAHRLCIDAVDKIVPFLELFPELEKCTLSGLEQKEDLTQYLLLYFAEFCVGPEDHASYSCRLIEKLSVSFARGSLAKHLLLRGVVDGLDTAFVYGCEKKVNGECSFCSRILRTFPLNNLLQLHQVWTGSCYSNRQIEKRIKSRKWTEQCLITSSARFAAQEVIEVVPVFVGCELRKSLERKQAKKPYCLYYLPRFKARRLSFMLDLGIKMSMREGKFTSKKSRFFEYFPEDAENGRYALAKSAFDIFVRAGYPFEEDDFIVVDDTSDPTLKKLMEVNDKRRGLIDATIDEE